jgi:hypothetical protein
MVPGLDKTAYKVTRSLWTLYNSLSAATLTLTDVAPTGSFRCAVTLSASGAHTDYSGTVTIGSETLTFTVASKKTTTTSLSALPIITTLNIDYNIKVTCIDTTGQDLYKETLSSILCAWAPVQKRFLNSQGEWTMADVVAMTETAFNADDIIEYNSYDYAVKQVEGGYEIMGNTAPYRLMLTGGGISPIGREVDDMQKAIYDTDNDGIVDLAEGVRDLDTLPVAPVAGEIVVKDGKIYVAQ